MSDNKNNSLRGPMSNALKITKKNEQKSSEFTTFVVHNMQETEDNHSISEVAVCFEFEFSPWLNWDYTSNSE